MKQYILIAIICAIIGVMLAKVTLTANSTPLIKETFEKAGVSLYVDNGGGVNIPVAVVLCIALLTFGLIAIAIIAALLVSFCVTSETRLESQRLILSHNSRPAIDFNSHQQTSLDYMR